jgi:plasmid maintenance system antidote protein VapI
MTPEEKVKLKAENKEKYGLTPEYIDYLQLPKACNVKVYQIDKIINGKKKLTTAEKIEHLIDIKQSLHKKLEVIRNGGTIKEFDYLSPQ